MSIFYEINLRNLLYVIFSVSFHLRLGEILALSRFFPYNRGSHEEAGGQHHPFGLYPVTGRFSFLVSSTSYKPCGSEPFILCEHFHVRHKPDLGVPLLIGGPAHKGFVTWGFRP